ncbi:MAG: amidophosphoribosyltransferase [Bdellovibrionota bacterium]|nr:amidophosphoribosyltransferase [Bdellovibrionota bacterium]
MCGIIGLIGPLSEEYSGAQLVHKGLGALQHRGQDAAGIISSQLRDERFCEIKGPGLIREVFDGKDLKELNGLMTLGHNRYTTVGSQSVKNIPPFQKEDSLIRMALVHNGNIINFHKVAEEEGLDLRGENDGEFILGLFHKTFCKLLKKMPPDKNVDFSFIMKVIQSVSGKIEGGYAFLIMIEGLGLVAFRDLLGIRSLVMGQKGKSYSFSSETVGLDSMGYKFLRAVSPGEVIFINEEGVLFNETLKKLPEPAPCMFEWVYFSSAKSRIMEESVKDKRIDFGKILGKKIKKARGPDLGIDVICPVPETGQDAALGVASILDVPLVSGIKKVENSGRTFILPCQEREKALKKKFLVGPEVVKGKSLLLVDDSLVRGNTLRALIKELYLCGAKELTFAFSCPPVTHGCYYGVDFPDQKELLASNRTVKEMSTLLGVKELFFITKNELVNAFEGSSHCFACVSGKYPVGLDFCPNFIMERRKQRQTPEVRELSF